MKQNTALEMFEYLKEHLIPLAKDKGDKVYENDTTVQIARPENKCNSNRRNKECLRKSA